MNKLALAVISLGTVLLIVLSAMYVLVPRDASLETERGQVFTGLNPWKIQGVYSSPAKVGDLAYLLMRDTVIVGDNVTYERSAIRLNLLNGSVDEYVLDDMGGLANGNYVKGFIEGDGGLYAYGLQTSLDPNSTEMVLWEVNQDTMGFGEKWVLPDTTNMTMCDLVIEDGLLYRMPGYASELDDDGENVSRTDVPTIVIWDLSTRELEEVIDVPNELCESELLPFGDVFFGYSTGMKPLSQSFEFDPESGTTEPIPSLEGYDQFRVAWGDAALVGDGIVFPYLSEYVDFKWSLSETVIALDRSYNVVEGELTIDRDGFWWLMACSDDAGSVLLQCNVIDYNTTMNITAYHMEYDEAVATFHPALFAIPLIVIAAGVVMLVRKK